MAAPPDYEGFLDGVHHGRVSGWARDKANPERRLRVVVRDFDVPVAEGIADLPRGDVASDGKGDGRYGFSIPLPVTFLDGGIHNIYVTPEDSEVPVGGCPRPFGHEEGRELLNTLYAWRERSGANEAPVVVAPRTAQEKRAAHGRISAIIVLHDDGDFLRNAVASVADFADEVILCDGGYRHQEPFLDQGRKLDRSRNDVFDGLTTATFTPKVRHVRGVWEDEAEKRTAAYESCSGDFVYVVEPDEIHAVDEGGLDAFLGSGRPVGTVLLREMATDKLCRRSTARGPGRLFDRRVIGASEHLAYLGSAEPLETRLPDLRYRAANIHPVPVGTAYRLGGFRPLPNAARVARDRWLSLARARSPVPWAPGLALSEPVDLGAAVSVVGPMELLRFAAGHPHGLGFEPDPALRYRRIEVPPRARRAVSDAYKAFKKSLEQAHTMGTEVALVPTVPAFLDVSSEFIGKPPGRTVAFELDGPVSSATVTWHRVRLDGADETLLRTGPVSGPIEVTVSHRELDGAPFRVFLSLAVEFPAADRVRRLGALHIR